MLGWFVCLSVTSKAPGLEKTPLTSVTSPVQGQLENVLMSQRQQLVQCVAKELHQEQPWFYGRITRDEADDTMKNDGHRDGKFL